MHRDHIVNFIDFAIFAENWLQTGGGLDGDFDDSGSVDVIDMANICFYWLEEEPIVAESQDVDVTEDQAVGVTLRAYDCNGSDDFAYSIIEQPLYGIAVIDVNRVIYAPDINYVGEDQFTFIAEKGGYQSNIATISIAVLADTDDDGLSDYDEINGTYGYVTDPYDPNSDGDDMPDGWELEAGLNPTINDASGNPDNDGLTNIEEYNIGTHPNIADTDGDGLKDGDESGHGTSPLEYDSDDDLLADGWEVQYGFDPTHSDVFSVDPNGNNIYIDSDLDGLDDFEEVIYGTNPKDDDTDNDGVKDGDEVNQCSDPNDEYDNTAPPANEICQLRLTIGDDSWSESERYKLVVGPVTHIARKFGEVQSGVYKFRTSRAYSVKIEHLESTLEQPDYDYTAEIEKVSIPEGVIFVKYDPNGILGEHGDWNDTTAFYAEGKMARIGLFRPNKTDMWAGELDNRHPSYRKRYYYHRIFEDNTLINFPGIPCQEELRNIGIGPKPKPTPGTTGHWDEDEQWPGGIAIRDELRYPVSMPPPDRYQVIKVDGIPTSPRYIIHFRPGESGPGGLNDVWKTTE